jgi:hypothetical protein
MPHKNGRIVSEMASGWPAGHKSVKLLDLRPVEEGIKVVAKLISRNLGHNLHVGMGGHGSALHFTSIGSQDSPRGHFTPPQGSLHLQIGQPLLRSRANPAGQNIRHDDAEHLDGAVQHFWLVKFQFDSPKKKNNLPAQFTSSSLSLRVPTISAPYSSTHQHSVLPISFEHCTGSKSPIREHLGILIDCPSSPNDLARLDSARLIC